MKENQMIMLTPNLRDVLDRARAAGLVNEAELEPAPGAVVVDAAGRHLSPSADDSADNPASFPYAAPNRLKPIDPCGNAWTPEDEIGGGCEDPAAWVCRRAALTPGATGDGASYGRDVRDAALVFEQMDYNTIGTIGQTRAAWEALCAIGPQVVSPVDGVAAGADYAIAYPTGMPLAIGVELHWSVSLQFWAPFTFRVRTQRVQVLGAQFNPVTPIGAAGTPGSADRDLTVKVQRKTNGGRVWVPFATRVAPSMQHAQTKVAFGSSVAADSATIFVTPPPGALFANFTVRAYLLTAHSPQGAAYLETIGAYQRIKGG